MFKELMPLLAERKIHILLAPASEGKVMLYIEPAKVGEKNEEAALLTPIQVQATPEELDEKLPTILKEWIDARSQVCASLQEALDASKREMERRAEESKKKAAEKLKKPASAAKTVAPAKPAAKVDKSAPATAAVVSGGTASIDGEEEDGGGSGEAPAAAVSPTEVAPPAAQVAAAAVETGETVSLF